MTKRDFVNHQHIDGLKDFLRDRADRIDPDWLASLNERKRKEIEFHDQLRSPEVLRSLDEKSYEKIHGNKKFYSTVHLSVDYIHHWIEEHSGGRIFLDYACGNGDYALRAAKAGAALSIGLDISPVAVQNARRAAAQEGISKNIFFIQGDCEQTKLPDCCVDTVLCAGMLHHLDLHAALKELKRIMKPGAIVLAIEALDYNPLIKLYRKITPKMRTDWEKKHILSLREVCLARTFFEVQDIRYWHLFSIAAAFFPQGKLFKTALAWGNWLDRGVLKIPFVNRLAWMFSFELKKSSSAVRGAECSR